jgi:hypothetical protein
MEEIRRMNKLWSNESMCLRSHLDISVPFDYVDCDDSHSSNNNSVIQHNDLMLDFGFGSPSSVKSSDNETHPNNDDSAYYSPGATASGSFPQNHHQQQSERTADDILNRIDSTIAEAKSRITNLTANSP